MSVMIVTEAGWKCGTEKSARKVEFIGMQLTKAVDSTSSWYVSTEVDVWLVFSTYIIVASEC